MAQRRKLYFGYTDTPHLIIEKIIVDFGLFVIFVENDKIKVALSFKYSKASNLSSAISAQNAVEVPLFCTKKAE